MLRIKTAWGPAIAAACRYSSVCPAFMAALIANESGGEPTARRFEHGVYQHLRAVLDGKEDHYGSIDKTDLSGCRDSDVREFSTSWGLTQIMGYHLLNWGHNPDSLLDPKFNLDFATRLLANFAQAYNLDLRAEFEEMFRCWNTGHPYDDAQTKRVEGKTTDPEYVPNGLRRMEIYREIVPC